MFKKRHYKKAKIVNKKINERGLRSHDARDSQSPVVQNKSDDGKVKNYNRIKDETYFVENLHNVDSGMQISVRVCVLLMELEKVIIKKENM